MTATVHTLPRPKTPKFTPPPQPTHVVIDPALRWKFDYLLTQMREIERIFAGPSAPIASIEKADGKFAIVEAALPSVRSGLGALTQGGNQHV